jgi:Fe/S biogenesis protein NfuA
VLEWWGITVRFEDFGGPCGGVETMAETAGDTRNRIQEMIDYQINPAVAGHGGFIEFIDYKEGVVYLRMGGGCQGCGMANVTLKQGIERMLREEIPEIQQIMDVTDHAGGSNPYYQPSK